MAKNSIKHLEYKPILTIEDKDGTSNNIILDPENIIEIPKDYGEHDRYDTLHDILFEFLENDFGIILSLVKEVNEKFDLDLNMKEVDKSIKDFQKWIDSEEDEYDGDTPILLLVNALEENKIPIKMLVKFLEKYGIYVVEDEYEYQCCYVDKATSKTLTETYPEPTITRTSYNTFAGLFSEFNREPKIEFDWGNTGD